MPPFSWYSCCCRIISSAKFRDVDYRCFVFSGNAVPELVEMKEHEVVCQWKSAKASRALREMYEELVRG